MVSYFIFEPMTHFEVACEGIMPNVGLDSLLSCSDSVDTASFVKKKVS